ncbi:MAG: VanZ family protein [Nocardioides sp.]
MSDQVVNGLIATALGAVVAVLLLVPTAAVQYRRDGRLGPGDVSILLGAAVYGLALWTYTLLPFPAGDGFRCQESRLSVWISLRPVLRHGLLPLAELLHRVAFQQLAFNVLLFVPLGFFVRWVVHRGVLASVVLGFLVSVSIEVTQITGVWGLYRCAYRTFDVDDLITNTAGALIGGALAWVFIHPDRDAPERLPTRISLGRRWVGFVGDAIVVAVGAGVSGLLLRVLPLGQVPVAAVLVLPLLVEAVCVLSAGRTVGEWAISVKAMPRRWPSVVARPIKLLTGVGAFGVLALPAVYGGTLLVAFVVLTLACSIGTKQHRGLSHWLAGMDLVISR